ncbi:MAG: chemotaxis protein CheW [Crocosphaera sp.]
MSTTETSSLSRLQELLPQLFETPQIQGEPYLSCQLTSQINGLVSMEFVKESLLVAGEQITILPSMSSFVMGLMTSRDRVFFVIDLPHLLGLSSPFTLLQTYQMIVIRASSLMSQTTNNELLLGLAVPRIQGVIRVISDKRETDQKDLPESLLPFIQETLKEGENALHILNLINIIKKVKTN